ncbi:MAG: hypothetical protein LH468_10635 [Nocardioides sp.]|nr:hypothetical protein [Nocardioides sp.]
MTVFPEVLARAGRPARPLGVPPLHLLAGEPRHGVTRVAGELARATGAPTSTELTLRGRPEAVHLHVTDRVLARRPAQAAELVERLARRTRLTLTAHDVPQPSDGRAFAERRVAYERMLSAAHAWVTSSEHERRLVAEHCDTSPGAVIPLPLILPDVQPPARTVVAGPTIGLFGHVYPGKGHREAGEAAAGLRERGRTVTVLVIGGPGPATSRRSPACGRTPAPSGCPWW